MLSDEDVRATPDVARQVFGPAVPAAERYWEWLADAGITRGLIGPREVPRLWERHIINCAVVGECLSVGETIVDIGSGAGLPGIPLAIVRPDTHVTLVEPLLRRATFLKEVVADLGLSVTVVRGRAEERSVVAEVGGADVVTSRAVAPLDRLASWSAPLVRPGGRLVALKGSSATAEVSEHRDRVRRSGLVDLVVRECGVGVLSTPTIVIEGRRVAGGSAPRGDRRGPSSVRRSPGSGRS